MRLSGYVLIALASGGVPAAPAASPELQIGTIRQEGNCTVAGVRGNVTLNCPGVDPVLVRALNEQFKDQLKQRDLRIEQITRQANNWLSAMNASTCSNVSEHLLVLAIRSRNASQTLKYLRCNPELIATSDVRNGAANLFSRDNFAASKDYREQLRAGGIRFVHDFQPSYGPPESPLETAAKTGCVECVDWLFAGQDREDAKLYSLIMQDLAYHPAPNTLTIMTRLVDAGMLKDDDKRSAYHNAYSSYVLLLAQIDQRAAELDLAADLPARTNAQVKLLELRGQTQQLKPILDYLSPPDMTERKQLTGEIATLYFRDDVERLDKLIQECQGFWKSDCGRPEDKPGYFRSDLEPLIDTGNKTAILRYVAGLELRKHHLQALMRGE